MFSQRYVERQVWILKSRMLAEAVVTRLNLLENESAEAEIQQLVEVRSSLPKRIKAWLKERGEGPGPVIRSSFGSGYSEEGFRGAFKRLRTQVGVKVTFAQIRDGAYTASCQVGIDERASKILAGHSSGTSDRYIMRNPQITQTAVDAIRHKYGIREPFRRK